jgi:N-acetylglucosamine-6-sulfatase
MTGEAVHTLRQVLVGAFVIALTATGAGFLHASWPASADTDTAPTTARMAEVASVRLGEPARQQPQARKAPRPNVVVVMMDDFSMDLVQTMRSARQMKRAGASYRHSYVVDSLCCVSRSSFFTGQYPRQTGVHTNTSNQGTSRLGGWPAFRDNGNQARSFNVRLQQAGYHTGFIGKYLNEYEWAPGRALPPVVPGWSTFNVVFGSAYDGWDFASTEVRNGTMTLRQHPAPPASASAAAKDKAYAGTVIGDLALDFIREREASSSPYFLEVAVYAPHNRVNPEGHYPGDPLFPAMFRDRNERGCGRVPCSSLGVDDLPGFGDKRRDNRPRLRNGKVARAWNTARSMPASVAVRDLRDRARMAQSVDRLVRRILKTVGDNTYVVFTSDNGFHLGQQGMGRGKGTAYTTDVQVPLYVVGPGVVPGVRHEVTSNIDLASTFEELAGLKPASYRSGTSLVPTFRDRRLDRRRYAFFEHTQQTLTGGDPDAAFTGSEIERIPSFTAVRSRTGLLIRVDLDPSAAGTTWGYEFYSYKRARYEQRNQFASPRKKAEVEELMAKLEAFDQCNASGNTAVTRKCRNLTR